MRKGIRVHIQKRQSHATVSLAHVVSVSHNFLVCCCEDTIFADSKTHSAIRSSSVFQGATKICEPKLVAPAVCAKQPMNISQSAHLQR